MFSECILISPLVTRTWGPPPLAAIAPCPVCQNFKGALRFKNVRGPGIIHYGGYELKYDQKIRMKHYLDDHSVCVPSMN